MRKLRWTQHVAEMLLAPPPSRPQGATRLTSLRNAWSMLPPHTVSCSTGERGLAAAERMRVTIVAVVLLGLDDGLLGRSPTLSTLCSRLVHILRTASTAYNTGMIGVNNVVYSGTRG